LKKAGAVSLIKHIALFLAGKYSYKGWMLILIDNYDSFTYNLVQYFGDLGLHLSVHRNDKITVNAVMYLEPRAIIISPGPGTPEQAGICLDLVRAAAKNTIPLLGVCLGHQAIGQAFGGKVIRAPEPIHGKVSPVTHNGQSVFANLPSPLTVTRYHSLVVERDTLPSDLEITAETEDGLIMGLAHKQRPVHGVQFHPESIATPEGLALLKNFVDLL